MTIPATILKETDKAIHVEITISTFRGLMGWKVWFPKSVVTIGEKGLEVPKWLVIKKDQEISKEFARGRGGFERIMTA